MLLVACPWCGARPEMEFRCGGQGHLTRHRLGQLLKDLAVQAGVEPAKVSPHVLRHAFGTYMVSCRTDIRTLQSMMGHSDIRTTQIYLHCDANTGVLNKTPFAKLLASPNLVQSFRQSGANTPSLRRFTGTD